MSNFDLYTGWIVAFVDGQWRKVHISPGFVTLAPWLQPNAHLGVFTETEAAKAINGEDAASQPIGQSPHALVAGPVLDPNVLDRISFVRFGRVAGWNADAGAIIDSLDTARRLAGSNFDDGAGLDPDWPRLPPPDSPSRWTRTARSLVVS